VIPTRRRSLYFTGPSRAEVREEPLPAPAAGQLCVSTAFSAISAGTELLFYRGNVPHDIPVDSTIAALKRPFEVPIKYGYAAAGEVVGCGSVELESWLGRKVFSFHPHESAFLAEPAELLPIPSGIETFLAVFLPSMETSLNLVMDAAPGIGEQVAVLGQGVVGLLATALLARYPLSSLVTADRAPLRREASAWLGATAVIDAGVADPVGDIRSALAQGRGADGADLCFELTGAPEALAEAIGVTGFEGRVVIGSWYGTKSASVPLGGKFHRSRIRLQSSQVSTVGSVFLGRWTKESRLTVAWDWIRRVAPARLVSHRLPIERAPEAYRFLAEDPSNAIQVVITY